MKKEVLRLQMLSGIISESVYKEKLEEGAVDPKAKANVSESLNEGILTTLGGIALGAMAVKKAYDYVSNALLKRRMEETGEVKKGSNGVTMKQYRDKNSGEMFWGIQVIDKTKDGGYQSDNILLFKDSPERIEKILNSTIKWDTSDEAQMDDDYLDRFGQFKADKRMSMAENSDKQKIKISKKELAKIISEEIVRFKKKSLLENRLREIDEELEMLNEGNLPSVSPEALLEPLEDRKEKVEKDFNSFIEGVELIELTLWEEEMLFGVAGAKEGTGYDGLLAKKFPEIFSKEAIERYEGGEIDNYFLPIAREELWLKLIEPIALHYGYGFDGPNYSKIKAAKMALERGKKYVIAQYMS